MQPELPGSSPRIAIAGAGRVGSAVGRALVDLGADVVCVASRDVARAAATASFLGPGVIAVGYRDVPLTASHLLLAVSDSAIEAVAEEIASSGVSLRAALHTSGNCGPEALIALGRRGVSIGVLHPFQTVLDTASLRGISFGIYGDKEATEWAEAIVTALGGRVLRISPDGRPLYHAAAVMASNYIAALMDAAQTLLRRAGLGDEESLRALGPLARTAVDNAVNRGPAAALTGPIVRGDARTVASHIAALDDLDPSIAALYVAAGLHTLTVAQRAGLSEQRANLLRAALSGENGSE